MKKCPSCGIENSDDSGFCISCGVKLVAGYPSKPKKQISSRYIPLLMIIIIILGAISVYYFYPKKRGGEQTKILEVITKTATSSIMVSETSHYTTVMTHTDTILEEVDLTLRRDYYQYWINLNLHRGDELIIHVDSDYNTFCWIRNQGKELSEQWLEEGHPLVEQPGDIVWSVRGETIDDRFIAEEDGYYSFAVINEYKGKATYRSIRLQLIYFEYVTTYNVVVQTSKTIIYETYTTSP